MRPSAVVPEMRAGPRADRVTAAVLKDAGVAPAT